ncbi:MAG: nucleotidyltransferase domain-containing protein [Anaerolineae bacterium]|nr:nucleotidyltransferase domain-containing protein [Anaerolineae bacterium]
MTIQEQSRVIIERCKRVLQQHYGPRFRGLILYGSVARHQAEPQSDLDLLVLLTQPFDYCVEVRRIIDLLYPIQLESERLISAKPVAVEAFEHGDSQLYRNAKREGVRV